jgi:hypothetical protein
LGRHTASPEEAVARAKRTDRAEARRRYRAALAAEAAEPADATLEDETDETDETDKHAARPAGRFGRLGFKLRSSERPVQTSPARGATSPNPSGASNAPFQRVGFVDAMRLSLRPANIRQDLEALPELLRSRAVWPISLVVLVVTLLYILVPGQPTMAVVVSTLLQPPALIPPFVAGLLAPRAAWLAGGVVSLLASAATALIYVGTPAARSADQSVVESLVFFLAVSPIFGIGVGAFAGFYRRFLRLSAPTPRGGQKPRRQPARSRSR